MTILVHFRESMAWDTFLCDIIKRTGRLIEHQDTDGVDHEEQAAAEPVGQGFIEGRNDQEQVGRHLPGSHGVDGGLVFHRVHVPGPDLEQIEQGVGLHGGVHVGRDLVHDVDDRQHDHGEQQVLDALGALGFPLEPRKLPLLPGHLVFQGRVLL